jgi:hypothetical protein
VTEQPRPWDITIKIAVEAADEAGARALVDEVIAAMDITAAGTPPFVRFDDGTWVTELKVAEPVFDETEEGAMNVLSDAAGQPRPGHLARRQRHALRPRLGPRRQGRVAARILGAGRPPRNAGTPVGARDAVADQLPGRG